MAFQILYEYGVRIRLFHRNEKMRSRVCMRRLRSSSSLTKREWVLWWRANSPHFPFTVADIDLHLSWSDSADKRIPTLRWHFGLISPAEWRVHHIKFRFVLCLRLPFLDSKSVNLNNGPLPDNPIKVLNSNVFSQMSVHNTVHNKYDDFISETKYFNKSYK